MLQSSAKCSVRTAAVWGPPVGHAQMAGGTATPVGRCGRGGGTRGASSSQAWPRWLAAVNEAACLYMIYMYTYMYKQHIHICVYMSSCLGYPVLPCMHAVHRAENELGSLSAGKEQDSASLAKAASQGGQPSQPSQTSQPAWPAQQARPAQPNLTNQII